MTERILSPGVFTQENDQSFIAQGVAQIGAAFVGPTVKGPAFVPTKVSSYSEFNAIFGPETADSYVPYTVKNYLRSGATATVTRILGNGGWTFNGTAKKLVAIVSGSKIITVLHPSQNSSDTAAELGQSSLTGTYSNFILTISGSAVGPKSVSSSLDNSSNKYITKVLGTSEYAQTASAFPYLHFSTWYNGNVTGSATASFTTSSAAITFTGSYAEGYDSAATPWVVSAANVRLFRLVHRSHGFATNTDVKVAIAGITPSTVDGEYSTFSVIVRKFGDTDRQPSIVEQYNNVSLDPNATNYIAKVIGDKNSSYNSDLGKVQETGDYANISKYIRVEVADSVANAAIDSSVTPDGFEAIYETISGFTGYTLPTASLVSSNTSSVVYSGFDYSETDNLNYLKPLPLEASTGSNAAFHVPAADNKFMLPMQGGSDGVNYATIKKTGNAITATNMQGYDLSTSTSAGTVAYQKAFDILSNQDEYDFNLLVTPGVIKKLHSSVTSLGINVVEERTDALYIMDLSSENDTIATAVAEVAGIDSNYVASYYPWVKITDTATNKLVAVPPSVVIPQVLAYTDSVSAEYFAPAGLVRGGLGGVVDVKNKLSKAERDTLYSNRINPIASFPGEGICVWGQKTLQVKASALDRINVRRLLIAIRKFVASSSRYLVFEQNTNVTRNRFLSIVNPYLESIQQKGGLYSFQVVMDDSNNTADVIDRNQLVGAIYLQPSKTAEFIILDFNILPTGGAQI